MVPFNLHSSLHGSKLANINDWKCLSPCAVLVYVQETVAWGWGYAVPAFGLGIAFVLFISGLPKYRHQPPTGSPLTEVAQVFTAAILNAKVDVPADPGMLHDAKVQGKRNVLHTNSLRCIHSYPCFRALQTSWSLLWAHSIIFRHIASQLEVNAICFQTSIIHDKSRHDMQMRLPFYHLCILEGKPHLLIVTWNDAGS